MAKRILEGGREDAKSAAQSKAVYAARAGRCKTRTAHLWFILEGRVRLVMILMSTC
jgi:hypothetical protein